MRPGSEAEGPPGMGSVHLPQWSSSGALYHTVAVVGYNDSNSTFAVMDTCGPGCNNTGQAAHVAWMSQSQLLTLVKAETDHDGIVY
jgi:hypothetical protein